MVTSRPCCDQIGNDGRRCVIGMARPFVPAEAECADQSGLVGDCSMSNGLRIRRQLRPRSCSKIPSMGADIFKRMHCVRLHPGSGRLNGILRIRNGFNTFANIEHVWRTGWPTGWFGLAQCLCFSKQFRKAALSPRFSFTVGNACRPAAISHHSTNLHDRGVETTHGKTSSAIQKCVKHMRNHALLRQFGSKGAAPVPVFTICAKRFQLVVGTPSMPPRAPWSGRF